MEQEKINVNCVIGIDPGAAGGLAVHIPCYDGRITRETHVAKMPKDVRDLADFFAYYKENYKPIVFLEKLSVRPDDVAVEGGKPNMGKIYRVQKMMANFEHLKALIETAGIPYVQCHPMTWQSKLKLRTIGGVKEAKADRKRRYQQVAGQLYPEIKVTLWNADALLIMHFGIYALANEQKWVKEQLPEREYQKLF